MAGPLTDSQAGGALNGVASDARSLDQLRQLASQDPAKAVKAVATQFEALFMQMVLKSMREATPKSGMLDSQDQETYTAMLDQQLAQKIAAGGTGLGAVIARQLSRNLPHPIGATAPAPATPGASPAAGTAAPGAPTQALHGTAAVTVAAPAASPAPAPAPAASTPAATAGTASGAGAVLLRTIRASAAVRAGK
jgi:flagellar protein FlgJ